MSTRVEELYNCVSDCSRLELDNRGTGDAASRRAYGLQDAGITGIRLAMWMLWCQRVVAQSRIDLFDSSNMRLDGFKRGILMQ